MNTAIRTSEGERWLLNTFVAGPITDKLNFLFTSGPGPFRRISPTLWPKCNVTQIRICSMFVVKLRCIRNLPANHEFMVRVKLNLNVLLTREGKETSQSTSG